VLSQEIAQAPVHNPAVYFLRNHGVIVAHEDPQVAFDTIQDIIRKSKKYVQDKALRYIG